MRDSWLRPALFTILSVSSLFYYYPFYCEFYKKKKSYSRISKHIAQIVLSLTKHYLPEIRVDRQQSVEQTRSLWPSKVLTENLLPCHLCCSVDCEDGWRFVFALEANKQLCVAFHKYLRILQPMGQLFKSRLAQTQSEMFNTCSCFKPNRRIWVLIW